MREAFSITLTVEYKINFLYWITFEYWHLQGEGVNLNYMLKLFQLIIFYFKATAIDKSNSIYSTKHVFFINILRVMHKPMYIYKWSDYGDSHQRRQKWYVTILSKLECELYLIWKYERKDEYLSVYILMFIYQLNRIKYPQ